MAAKQSAPVSPKYLILWVVRGAFILAATALTFWLFVLYTPPAPAQYPGREEVVFWHMWAGDHAKMVQRIVDKFNESQGKYEVRSVTVAGGSIKTLIATAGGDPPDCLAQWDSVIPAWAERNALTPLEEMMPPEQWAELEPKLYPAVKAIGSYKGHFYGLPVGMNIFAMYYRPSHIKETFPDRDPNQFPATLEEMDKLAAALWQYKDGAISRIGFMPSRIQAWVSVFGGSLYDAEADKLTLTAPRNVAALEWMTDYAKKYDFKSVTAFQGAQQSTLSASWPFIGGAFSITVDGQWRVEELHRYAPTMDYATAPIPYPAGGKPMAGWCNGNFMLIPSGAKNKQGAWEFMKFWSGIDDPQRAAEFYTYGGWLPIMPEIAEAPIYREYVKKFPQFQTFVDILASPNVQVTPPVPVQAYLIKRVDVWARDAAMDQKLSPAAALEQVGREIDREMRRYQDN